MNRYVNAVTIGWLSLTGCLVGSERPRQLPAGASEGSLGQWSDVMEWGYIAIHLSLLPNQRVIGWGFENGAAQHSMADLWNPAEPASHVATEPLLDRLEHND